MSDPSPPSHAPTTKSVARTRHSSPTRSEGATAIAPHRPASDESSWRDPALWLTALVAALCVLITGGTRVDDTDFWQHLVVGKAIWQLESIPATQLWSWPTYGAPDVNPSWGFSAIFWPLWSAFGVAGLFLWRWVAMLLAFGMLWAAARRMGARGLTPLWVVVLGSIIYLDRSPIGPRTLVAVLLAIQIAILETRRQGGRDWSLGLILVAWAWANVHLSYFLGFIVLGAYLVHDAFVRRPHGFESALAPDRRRLAWVTIAAIAISFVNPFGWRALWQPLELFLRAKDDPIYRAMAESSLFSWPHGWRSGLPLVMFLWPAILVWRWWRTGFDAAETVLCVALTWLALSAQRFAGFYALVAVPFLARDLDLLVRAFPRPAWAAAPMARAGLVSAACIAVGLLAWTRPDRPLGVALDMKCYPVRAADFIEAHGVRGRTFNHFHLGGYLAYRFWPDRERLPFMDVDQSGTRQDRLWYARVFTDPQGWPVMDRTYRFESVLLDASQSKVEADWLKDNLDADTTWSLVFLDDAAALYLRRSGSFAELARRFEYIAIPAGEARLDMLGQGTQQDSLLRQLARMELQRQINESPFNARAQSLMANLDITQGNFSAARQRLEEALRQDPLSFAAHERLGMIAMEAGQGREAMREFEIEKRLTGGTADLSQRLAQARAVARGSAPRTGH